MRCFIAFFFALTVSFFAFSENDSCSVVSFDNDDCPLKGRVKIVKEYPDLTIKIVEEYPDIEVTVVDSYVEDECGRIMIVNEYPNLYVKIVNEYPDITIRFKDSKSKDMFIQQLTNPK